jgi:hypothetical protein
MSQQWRDEKQDRRKERKDRENKTQMQVKM